MISKEQGQRMPLFRRAFQRETDAHLAPGRGALVTVAMLVPLFIIEGMSRNRLDSSAAAGTLLGVLFVAFCDIGPALRTRMWAMGSSIVLGTLLMLLGAAIGGPWWVAVLALTLATVLSGLLPVYGPAAAQVGTILTIVFAVALGSSGGRATAVPTALGFLFGGVFIIVLVLVVAGLSAWLQWPAPQSPAAPLAPKPSEAPRPGLTLRSPVVRFALLRAAATGLIAGIAWGSGLSYPQWAPVVVITSVRPNQMAALLLTTQRVTGTVLGAGLADVVLLLVHDSRALAGLAVAGVFLAFTVIEVSYTLFVFFLTALTLLLLNIPASGPTYVRLRIIATLVGAGAALGVSLLAAWLARRTAPSSTETPPGSAVA